MACLVVLFRVDTLVLLEILWPLEQFATRLARMRLQGRVDTEVARDVIALRTRHITSFPFAVETEIICGFPPNMVVAKVEV